MSLCGCVHTHTQRWFEKYGRMATLTPTNKPRVQPIPVTGAGLGSGVGSSSSSSFVSSSAAGKPSGGPTSSSSTVSGGVSSSWAPLPANLLASLQADAKTSVESFQTYAAVKVRRSSDTSSTSSGSDNDLRASLERFHKISVTTRNDVNALIEQLADWRRLLAVATAEADSSKILIHNSQETRNPENQRLGNVDDYEGNMSSHDSQMNSSHRQYRSQSKISVGAGVSMSMSISKVPVFPTLSPREQRLIVKIVRRLCQIKESIMTWSEVVNKGVPGHIPASLSLGAIAEPQDTHSPSKHTASSTVLPSAATLSLPDNVVAVNKLLRERIDVTQELAVEISALQMHVNAAQFAARQADVSPASEGHKTCLADQFAAEAGQPHRSNDHLSPKLDRLPSRSSSGLQRLNRRKDVWNRVIVRCIRDHARTVPVIDRSSTDVRFKLKDPKLGRWNHIYDASYLESLQKQTSASPAVRTGNSVTNEFAKQLANVSRDANLEIQKIQTEKAAALKSLRNEVKKIVEKHRQALQLQIERENQLKRELEQKAEAARKQEEALKQQQVMQKKMEEQKVQQQQEQRQQALLLKSPEGSAGTSGKQQSSPQPSPPTVQPHTPPKPPLSPGQQQQPSLGGPLSLTPPALTLGGSGAGLGQIGQAGSGSKPASSNPFARQNSIGAGVGNAFAPVNAAPGVTSGSGSAPLVPTATTMPAVTMSKEELRSLLIKFYTSCDPDKLSNVDHLVEKYVADPVKLMKVFLKKYTNKFIPFIPKQFIPIIKGEEGGQAEGQPQAQALLQPTAMQPSTPMGGPLQGGFLQQQGMQLHQPKPQQALGGGWGQQQPAGGGGSLFGGGGAPTLGSSPGATSGSGWGAGAGATGSLLNKGGAAGTANAGFGQTSGWGAGAAAASGPVGGAGGGGLGNMGSLFGGGGASGVGSTVSTISAMSSLSTSSASPSASSPFSNLQAGSGGMGSSPFGSTSAPGAPRAGGGGALAGMGISRGIGSINPTAGGAPGGSLFGGGGTKSLFNR
jgi:hypothetical protein